MPFKKNEISNPNGRPKGTPNRTTTEVKQWINNFIDKQTPQFEVDFQNLDPIQRIQIFEKLLSYILPKPQAMEIIEATPKISGITFCDCDCEKGISKLRT